jgi:hypothetical protein
MQDRPAGEVLDLDPAADTEIHPIPVPLTEEHDQSKGRLAQRLAVDL